MVAWLVYDWQDAEEKAGNVRRVARRVPDVPGPDPFNWTVHGTDFDYHRNGEVRMIIQRIWRDDGGAVSNDQLLSIHEVRGNGQRLSLAPTPPRAWRDAGFLAGILSIV